jgi:hypothetical protein
VRPDTEFENNKDAANLDIQTFGRYGGVGLTIGTDFTYQKGKVRQPSSIKICRALLSVADSKNEN